MERVKLRDFYDTYKRCFREEEPLYKLWDKMKAGDVYEDNFYKVECHTPITDITIRSKDNKTHVSINYYHRYWLTKFNVAWDMGVAFYNYGMEVEVNGRRYKKGKNELMFKAKDFDRPWYVLVERYPDSKLLRELKERLENNEEEYV